MREKRTVEVCFSPKLFDDILTTGDFVVVLVDILRATTTICTAVGNEVHIARSPRTTRRGGWTRRRAFWSRPRRTACSSTSRTSATRRSASPGRRSAAGRSSITADGTRALALAERAGTVVIGAFVNVHVQQWLARRQQDVVVLCSGWKNGYLLEDALFAGALTEKLLDYDFLPPPSATPRRPRSTSGGLPVHSSYVEKAAQRHRLKRLELDDVIPYSFMLDADVVPGRIRGYGAR